MHALFHLLAKLPLPLMHCVGTLLGWLVWWASPTYRRRLVANAEGAGFSRDEYRPAIAAAGAMAGELPWVWFRPHTDHALAHVRSWDGIEAAEAALAEGKGAIFLTPHLGSWEMMGQALGERLMPEHGPLTALFRPARKVWMQPLVANARNRPGIQTLPTSVMGVRSLMRVLRAGGYTGLLPDQVPPQGQGVWAPFFGRPAYTITLVARLAQQTGAPVFITVCERLAPGAGFAIRVTPVESPALADRNASAEAGAQAINEAVETEVRRLPGQYLWGYARFKQPRIEPAASAPPTPTDQDSP